MIAGWCARSSGGPFRRINSATPGPDAAPLKDALPELDEFYSERNRPAILRLPDIVRVPDASLAAAGYGSPEAETDTRIALSFADGKPTQQARLSDTPDSQWLAARAALAGDTPEVGAATNRRIGSIADPIAFASIEREGKIVSLGYAIVAEGLVIFEAIRTDPALQGRGLARDSMLALLAWGREQGAEAAALQVVRDNKAAQRLYSGLGFDKLVYRYHYRFPVGTE
jgi:ribosomal protein S18 acetylase RimI-like enzyme